MSKAKEFLKDVNEGKEDKLIKELDALQMEIRKLMDSGKDDDFKKAQELQKEATKLMNKIYDIKKL